MQRDERITIDVRPAQALAARPRLFAALEDAFPVRFASGEPAAGAIVICDEPASAPAPGLPALVLADVPAREAPSAAVGLAASPSLDRRLRGIGLHDRPVGAPPAGALGEVLASTAGEVVWSREHGPAPVDRVRSALPELGPDDVLYGLLSRRAIGAVALIEFLRARTAPVAWRPPPLRAAFVFDDPNLRWRSYGHIDYTRLADHADEHGYHAAMAMVPLDAAWPHRPTVSLFTRRSDRLSLVFHGNDHVQGELLAPCDDTTALAVAAQAMRRIERFERRHGIRVDRVMMPPHGRCSQHMSRALGMVGFDALCAIHPTPWTAERPSSPRLVAWNVAEFVGGCAVIPRDALCATEADLALRAYLDHPVIVYGHHEDVAGGLDPLAEAAARVNGLGSFRWTSVGEISRTNFHHRVEGSTLAVRPFSRRLRIDVPPGVDSVRVEAPTPTGGGLELSGWSLGDAPATPFGATLPVAPGEHELRLRGTVEVDPATVAAPAWRPWPRIRRAATEARDRAMPLAG